MDRDRAREMLLTVVEDQAARYSQVRTSPVLQETATRLRAEGNEVDEPALLTLWYDLFRAGVISWGRSLSSPDLPLAHLTDHGRRTLEHRSRDPANPTGYLATVDGIVPTGTLARSYLDEALQTYAVGCYRAAAVMVGGAAEALALDLRDALAARLDALGVQAPQGLGDTGIRCLREALARAVEARRATVDPALMDRFTVYWPLSEHLRFTRTDTGRPARMEPVSAQVVHAALLLFPEYARLVADLQAWIPTITA